MNSIYKSATTLALITLFGILAYVGWEIINREGSRTGDLDGVKLQALDETVDTVRAGPIIPLNNQTSTSQKARFSDLSKQQLADGRILIKAAKEKIFEKWQPIERGNFEKIREYSDAGGTTLTFKLNSPSTEQIGKLTDFATTELEGFQGKGVPIHLLRETVARYIKELTEFPRRNLFIVIINPTDLTRPAKFWEMSTDLDALPTDQDGRMLAIPPRTSRREDADIGSEKSWASKRYGHFIEGFAGPK